MMKPIPTLKNNKENTELWDMKLFEGFSVTNSYQYV